MNWPSSTRGSGFSKVRVSSVKASGSVTTPRATSLTSLRPVPSDEVSETGASADSAAKADREHSASSGRTLMGILNTCGGRKVSLHSLAQCLSRPSVARTSAESPAATSGKNGSSARAMASYSWGR